MKVQGRREGRAKEENKMEGDNWEKREGEMIEEEEGKRKRSRMRWRLKGRRGEQGEKKKSRRKESI